MVSGLPRAIYQHVGGLVHAQDRTSTGNAVSQIDENPRSTVTGKEEERQALRPQAPG